MKIKIIQFEDGTYFNGVKGKLLRTTKSFKYAKELTTPIDERDLRHLEKYGVSYKVLLVELECKVIDELENKEMNDYVGV